MVNVNQKQKEAHKEIIADICGVINNCANCYDDGAMKINCNPLSCVHLYDVSVDSFSMDPYEDEINKRLIGIAGRHGYSAGIVIEDKEVIGIRFWRESDQLYERRINMIEEINKILEDKGSKFRTKDGFTICMYIGHLTFLKRTFETQEECLQFVSQ